MALKSKRTVSLLLKYGSDPNSRDEVNVIQESIFIMSCYILSTVSAQMGIVIVVIVFFLMSEAAEE